MFEPIARGMGLTNDQAQQLVEMHVRRTYGASKK
jgi:hypothetical protein